MKSLIKEDMVKRMDDRDKVDNDQYGKVYDHPHDQDDHHQQNKVDHHHHGKFDHYQHDEVGDHQRGASEGWHPCPITVMGESLQPAKPLD